MILGRRKGDLFSQRAVSDAVCLSSKLQPMVYAPSHTQSGYIYYITVELSWLTDDPWRSLATDVKQLPYLAF